MKSSNEVSCNKTQQHNESEVERIKLIFEYIIQFEPQHSRADEMTKMIVKPSKDEAKSLNLFELYVKMESTHCKHQASKYEK